MNSREPAVRPGIDVHQFYSLDMRRTPAAAQADIFSFTGVRGMCEPTRYAIRFTHPRHNLSRPEFLNQMATFVIQPPRATRWSQPEAPRHIQGVITGFAHLSSSPDQAIYEVVLESRLALLRNSPKCRFFLEMTEPEIIRQILRENEFNQIFASFQFDLSRTYRKHPIVTQWGEDDLTFITRLCRRTGIWFVCEEGRQCENVRFADDYGHYRRDHERFAVPYQEPDGLMTNRRESIHALEMHASTIPASYAVRSFSPEEPYGRVIAGKTQIRDDSTTSGAPCTWGLPYLDEDDARAEALLRQEAALAAQVTYSGACDMLDIAPSVVLDLSNRKLPDAKYGLVVVRVECSASRQQGYKVNFTAIPSERQYRHPLAEILWPRIEGVITGKIASTEGFVGPYLDEQGRYIVEFHSDADKRTPGLNSCPMRLAKPFAGPDQTGFHFGLEPGSVVTVAFLWGNPDLPFISQVLHTAEHTDPLLSKYPWSTRHTIRTRSNNTLQFDDSKEREHIKLATEHGKSQLNVGYMVNRDNEQRGEGFELRTDNHGSLRAGGGLLVSADTQAQAQGHQTDMQRAITQFSLTQAQAQELASAAVIAKTEVADLKAENKWLKDELADLKEAVIALSAPQGIGMATPGRMIVSTGQDVSVATAAGFNVNAFRRITMAAKDAISLFAHGCGVKLLAARGTVQMHALTDGLDIASKQDAFIRSTNGKVIIEAKDELLLKCGGSYISIKPHNLTHATQGDYVEKALSWSKSDPDGTITKSALPYVNDVADLGRHGSKFSG